VLPGTESIHFRVPQLLLSSNFLENESLWDFYCSHKAHMCNVNGTPNPNERHGVWQGTRSNDSNLIYEDVQEGFRPVGHQVIQVCRTTIT
jgi:hypothetical protein